MERLKRGSAADNYENCRNSCSCWSRSGNRRKSYFWHWNSCWRNHKSRRSHRKCDWQDWRPGRSGINGGGTSPGGRNSNGYSVSERPWIGGGRRRDSPGIRWPVPARSGGNPDCTGRRSGSRGNGRNGWRNGIDGSRRCSSCSCTHSGSGRSYSVWCRSCTDRCRCTGGSSWDGYAFPTSVYYFDLWGISGSSNSAAVWFSPGVLRFGHCGRRRGGGSGCRITGSGSWRTGSGRRTDCVRRRSHSSRRWNCTCQGVICRIVSADHSDRNSGGHVRR